MITGGTCYIMGVISIGRIVSRCDTQVLEVSQGLDGPAVVGSVACYLLQSFVGVEPGELILATVECHIVDFGPFVELMEVPLKGRNIFFIRHTS